MAMKMIPRAVSSVLPTFCKVKHNSRYSTEAVSMEYANKTGYPGFKMTVNGVDLHYEHVGQGEHPVLLMPGALGTSRSDFSQQIDDGLDKKTFTIVAWDPPGYGYSRPPKKDFFKGYLQWDAELADGLMSRLGYSKYSILGWSEGGTTGIHLAARKPHKVRSMAVWGTKTCWTPTDRRIINSLRDISKWNKSIRVPMESLYGIEGFKELVTRYCDFWENLGTTKSSNIENEEGGGPGDLCLGDLPKVKIPFLVVHGDRDPMVDHVHHTHMLNVIKTAKLARIKGGKHNLHHRHPKEFNDLVTEFFISH